MARISDSHLVRFGATPTSATLLAFSSVGASPAVRGALVLMACAGIGAVVATVRPGSIWRRALHAVLAVEGAFLGLILVWVGYSIASQARNPIPARILVPYVAMIAAHHAGLALAGALAAVALATAGRRIHAQVWAAHRNTHA